MPSKTLWDFARTLAEGEMDACEEILRVLDLNHYSAGFRVIGERAFVDEEGILTVKISKTYRFAVEDDATSEIKKGMLH